MKLLLKLFLGFIGLCVVIAMFSDDESANENTTKTTETVTEEAALSPAEVKKNLSEQLDREIASLKDFDGSGYRESVQSIQMEAVLFNAWAKVAKEGLLSDDKELNVKAAELKKQVSAIQKREYPQMRKAYIKIVKDKMWEHNIYVKGIGAKNDRIELVGAVFANNKNIKEIQTSLSEILSILRFKQADYKWYKEADEYTYYDIDSFPDNYVSEKVVK